MLIISTSILWLFQGSQRSTDLLWWEWPLTASRLSSTFLIHLISKSFKIKSLKIGLNKITNPRVQVNTCIFFNTTYHLSQCIHSIHTNKYGHIFTLDSSKKSYETIFKTKDLKNKHRIFKIKRGTHGIMVIPIRNELSAQGSNPEWGCISHSTSAMGK